jgi:hypothetical protein
MGDKYPPRVSRSERPCACRELEELQADLDRANEALERIESGVSSLIFAAPEMVDAARQQLATIAIREVRGYRGEIGTTTDPKLKP